MNREKPRSSERGLVFSTAKQELTRLDSINHPLSLCPLLSLSLLQRYYSEPEHNG
jgi:hypothetical protein